jgi:hypothetical protein
MEKWTSHVYGASTLLELRGQNELQSPEGLKLFIQLRFQIVSFLTHTPERYPMSYPAYLADYKLPPTWPPRPKIRARMQQNRHVPPTPSGSLL